MIWGPCQAKAYSSGILFFDPWNQNEWKKNYLDLLKDKLKLHMNTHESKIFMHNGAPCHKVKVVTSYLENEKVEVLLWPGNSLDINPTENF